MMRRVLLSRNLTGATVLAALSLGPAVAHAADALVIDKDAVRIRPGLEVGDNGAQINDKGATIQGFSGRNFFQDFEKAGALRVGAAWGVPGIYSQKGDVVVGSESKKIWLNGAVRADSFSGMGAVPVGAILMWSGAADTLPAGWALLQRPEGRRRSRPRTCGVVSLSATTRTIRNTRSSAAKAGKKRTSCRRTKSRDTSTDSAKRSLSPRSTITSGPDHQQPGRNRCRLCMRAARTRSKKTPAPSLRSRTQHHTKTVRPTTSWHSSCTPANERQATDESRQSAGTAKGSTENDALFTAAAKAGGCRRACRRVLADRHPRRRRRSAGHRQGRNRQDRCLGRGAGHRQGRREGGDEPQFRQRKAHRC